MTSCLARIFFVLAAGTFTWAFPNGGPYYSCKSLLPGHNEEPKSSSPPYKLSVSRTSVPLGGTTSVLLEGLNSNNLTPFMGFMCAASVFDDETNHTCGVFSLTTASSDKAQLLKCSGSATDTGITHVNKDFKEQISFDWAVPADANIGSTYKIRCTFVQSFDIFWINSLVKVTVVGGNENATTGGTHSSIVNIDSGTTTPVTTESSSIKTTDDKQSSTGSTTQGGIVGINKAGTGISDTTLVNLGNNSSTQFNVSESVTQDSRSRSQPTEAINSTFDLFRALEQNNTVMSGMSTPLNVTDKTTTADTVALTATSSSRNIDFDIVRPTDFLDSGLNITKSPFVRPNSSSIRFSENPSSPNQLAEDATPLTTTTMSPDQSENSTINTNSTNSTPGVFRRPINLVPDFIRQNPNAFFLNSRNLRNPSVRRSRL